VCLYNKSVREGGVDIVNTAVVSRCDMTISVVDVRKLGFYHLLLNLDI
jgi:hypothetical protein